jgi:purine-nucleoside/S-methyl-5'-thioadenosine phosphorylase / adenosine deaminase
MTREEFVRREADGVPYYSCPALEELSFVRHGFSTRHGGVSSLPGGNLNLSRVFWDNARRVDENRRRFMTALGLGTATLATLSQIHSDRLHIIEEKPGQWNQRPQADALATRLESMALAVQIADCFPVLMVDPRARVVAALHAGWRGTLARIVSKAVQAMELALDCDPARLMVAIGPGIRRCCFEVGPEVVEAFEREFPGAPLAEPRPDHAGKSLLDLCQALDVQFAEVGISRSQVFDLGLCTRCRVDEFFSYRGEGPKSGRLMAVISRVSD